MKKPTSKAIPQWESAATYSAGDLVRIKGKVGKLIGVARILGPAKKASILSIASLSLIKRLDKINLDKVHGQASYEQNIAAAIAVQAILALRDTVNRPDRPEVFQGRINQIKGILKSMPRVRKATK